MKITKQAIGGFFAGGIIAIGMWMLLKPAPPRFVYSEFKMDGATLARICSLSNFSKIGFYSISSGASTVRTDIEPEIESTDGQLIDSRGLITATGQTYNLGVLDVLAHEFYFSMAEPRQLTDILTAITNNAGAYFILEPTDGRNTDPGNCSGKLCYKINPFKSDGSRITGLDALVLQLNPCPPGSKPR